MFRDSMGRIVESLAFIFSKFQIIYNSWREYSVFHMIMDLWRTFGSFVVVVPVVSTPVSRWIRITILMELGATISRPLHV